MARLTKPKKSKGEAPLHHSAVRVVNGKYAGRIGYYDDDEGDRAVVYFGEPMRSGYVLIKRDHLADMTSPEHERSGVDGDPALQREATRGCVSDPTRGGCDTRKGSHDSIERVGVPQHRLLEVTEVNLAPQPLH